VLRSSTHKSRRVKRTVSAAVLLFVFLLPLHFHFSGTPQITKECACIHGARTQLAFNADTGTSAPAFHATLLIAQDDSLWADEWTKLKHVRGPPVSLSL
jgi:hypothetical protein